MKICKRILSLLLACILMCSTVGIVSAARDFSDLPSSHWAYSYVQKLVADGTINGYADGTFLPNKQVTRAEFVKMIGKTTKKFGADFTDVTTAHWAYDYIMYSDMDVTTQKFYPDVAITRNDVVKLLWKRAGSPTGNVIPSIITNQSDKGDAVAWAYTYGIMEGDDGVSLRLSDGLTRAEAAALICRSRNVNANTDKVDFGNNVNEKLLERVFNSFDVFEGGYSATKTYTNGEIAEAAMRIAADQSTVTYSNINTNVSVDRPNTLSFYVLCKNVWGEKKMTESFYDAKANNLDTLAALMYAFDYKANVFIDFSGKNDFYVDVKGVSEANANKYITAAYRLGVKLGSHNSIFPNADTNAKNIALMLLQFDAIAGLNSNYSVTEKTAGKVDASLKTEILSYPSNHSNFKYILKEVPNKVYSTPFVDIDGSVVDIAKYAPKDSFRFARDYNLLFTMFLQRIAAATRRFGAEVKYTYYPSLVTTTDKGYVMRVKVLITKVDANKQFEDLFPTVVKNGPKIYKGQEFYVDIATGAIASGMVIPIDDAVITNVILK